MQKLSEIICQQNYEQCINIIKEYSSLQKNSIYDYNICKDLLYSCHNYIIKISQIKHKK